MATLHKALSLSIVIPAYNEEHQLGSCLETIAAQLGQDDRVIVVDNNSTDKTAEIARKYPFVTLLREPKQGVVYARNRGFDAVEDGVIGRIDADTLIPPNWVNHIKTVYSEGKHSHSAWTGGCYFYNIRLKRVYGWLQGQIAFRMNRLLMGNYILFGSNMALPVKLWKDVRNKVCLETDIHEDLDLSIHLCELKYHITYQAGIKVGVQMRRVRSNRDQLWQNLELWPQTLRRHGRWTWIFGWLGAVFLYCISPLGVIMEGVARLFGRPALPE